MTHPSQLRIIKPLTAAQKKHHIAIVSCFQNEAPYLKEWVEFHLMMGVEHFYLLDDKSTDNYREILNPYIHQGKVTLYHSTDDPRFACFATMQAEFYSMIGRLVADHTEWLIPMDSDEFVFPHEGDTLPEVLKRYEGCAAISINYVNFGTSDVKKIPQDGCMIEHLTRCASPTHRYNAYVTTILKPRYCQRINVHDAIFKTGYHAVDVMKQPFLGAMLVPPQDSVLRFNHYWSRDKAFFKGIKIARKRSMEVDIFGYSSSERKLRKQEHRYNKYHDKAILRFVPALKKRLQLP